MTGEFGERAYGRGDRCPPDLGTFRPDDRVQSSIDHRLETLTTKVDDLRGKIDRLAEDTEWRSRSVGQTSVRRSGKGSAGSVRLWCTVDGESGRVRVRPHVLGTG